MKKQKNATRIIAVVLVVLMALALIPIAASAAAPDSVTLNRNDGSTGEGSSVLLEGSDTELTLPTGWRHKDSAAVYFRGWSTTAVFEGEDTDLYSETATVGAVDEGVTDLYAQWEMVTVSFEANGGSETMAPVKIAKGANYTVPECGFTPPEGKTFYKWSDGTNEYDPEDPITNVTSNITLTAEWAYTVSFAAGDHGSGSMNPVLVKAGDSYQAPACGFTAETGYGFYKWSAGTNEYAPNDSFTPTGDTTLTALWKQRYTVSYDLNGGVGTAEPQTCLAGDSVTLPTAPTKTRATFQGWKVGDTSTVLPSDETHYTPTATVTLLAQWEGDPITVTYAGNGNTGGSAPSTPPGGTQYGYGETFILPENSYTKTDKLFDGWQVGAVVQQPGEQLDWSQVADGETSLTIGATWADTVTIYYTPNGGTPQPSSDVLKKGEKLTSLPTVTKNGYTFLGWYNNGSKVAVPFDPGNTNKNLVAQWRSNQVTFKYDANGGTPETKTADKVTRGEDYTFPAANTFTPADNTKTFAYWQLGDDTTTKYYPGGTYGTDDETPEELTVKPIWADKCQVDFNAGEGTITSGESTVYVAKNEKIPTASIPTASRTGYSFLGWYDGDTKLDENYPAITGTKTFTAKWQNNTVIVTLDPNTAHGGGGISSTQAMSRVNTGTLRPFSGLGMSSPSGKVFKGWAKDATAATPDFADEASIKWNGASGAKNYAPPATDPEEASEVTLFALWDERLTGTLTVKDKTSGSDATSPVKVGQTLLGVAEITKPDDPGTLTYRWMAKGVNTPLGTGAEYTVKAADYKKQIYCEVTNTSDYSVSIKSSFFTVSSDELMEVPVTVTDGDLSNYVTVNGEMIITGSGTAQVPPGGIVEVRIFHDTAKYASKVEFGEGASKFTLEGADVGVVNRHNAPDTGDSYPVAVTFASNETPGTKKTATIDWSVPEALLNQIKSAVIIKVADTKGMTASERSRIKAVAHDYVACWDDIITRRLTQEQINSATENELIIYFAYPSDLVTTVNGKNLSSNIPAYYNIEVYHDQIYVGKAGDGKVTAQPSYSAPQAVAVKGQKSFSPYELVMTPNQLDGTVLIKGKNSDGNASIGSPLTAEYKDGATAHVGTLSYQWQVKNGENWEDISGDAAKSATFTPSDTYKDKDIRCKVTSSFEYGSKESDPVKVVSKPNPEWQRDIVNNGGVQTGLVKNVTSDMVWSGPSSTKPGTSATWHSITGTTFPVTEQGYYWVRFANDTSNTNVSDPVFVANYFTVVCHPDSVSVNRLYFEATTTGSSADSQLSSHPDVIYDKNNSNYYWIKENGAGITVYAKTSNSKYYKITAIKAIPTETSSFSKTGKSDSLYVTIGSKYTVQPYDVWASAGVYGSKTGDTSHLELWVELAALSLMGLGAALVLGRKKLKAQK